ncbi:hypothetical protein [Microcoleus sp. B9-D4]|uniref:hypothetical protein n=1 Tax=Microcoleus sp. B9-D4 TaxID=2818711 RepID=UPI002FD22643
MELFQASVKIVRPALSRVEGLPNKPSERARRDFESIAKVQNKLKELVKSVLITVQDCVPATLDCKESQRKKILGVITTVLENYDFNNSTGSYNIDDLVEYLDELVKNPELITPLLNEPVGD